MCIFALVNAAPAPQILGIYPGVHGRPRESVKTIKRFTMSNINENISLSTAAYPHTHHAYEEHQHYSGPAIHHINSPFFRHVSPYQHQFGAAYVSQPVVAQPGT